MSSLKRKYAIAIAILLITLVSVTLFLSANIFSKPASTREFFVGVEFAYGNSFSLVKSLVDKVQDYTNLFVLGSPGLTFNRTALDQSVDYINQTGLHFIVLITDSRMYNASNGYPASNSIFDWMGNASQKYGDRLLGIYRFDEPGGNQLDSGAFQLVKNATSYEQSSTDYVGSLSIIINYYLAHGVQRAVTADYGLYWFDYKCNYTTVLGEFVGNQSRERIIALNRGAAESFGKDWGVIINWKYNPPTTLYLESGNELFNDLSQAYSAGAKYAVVFSYPNVTGSNYGTLTQDHFKALQNFWSNIHNSPSSFPSNKAEVAYVVPKDYGFGFRSENDNIWGLFASDKPPANELSAKIWNDTNTLISQYGTHLNIIYDEPNVTAATLGNYTKVFYWNQTVP